MGKKNDSSIVAGAGFVADLIMKLRADVIELGGSDEDLFALNKGTGRKTIRKMAEMVVGSAKPAVRTLAGMIVAGRYDRVHPDITEERFPVRPESFTAEGSKFFHFDRIMTTAEVEAAIRSEGYEPASIERLLAYGASHPEEQRKYPIVALGSSWVDPDGDRSAPYLGGYDRERSVDLHWGDPGDQWDEHCRFLASRK